MGQANGRRKRKTKRRTRLTGGTKLPLLPLLHPRNKRSRESVHTYRSPHFGLQSGSSHVTTVGTVLPHIAVTTTQRSPRLSRTAHTALPPIFSTQHLQTFSPSERLPKLAPLTRARTLTMHAQHKQKQQQQEQPGTQPRQPSIVPDVSSFDVDSDADSGDELQALQHQHQLERQEQERHERQHQEQELERQHQEQELKRQQEQERLELKRQQEQERQELERQRQEQERQELERQRQEQELERQRQEQELGLQQEQERLERQRQEQELERQQEQERLERQKLVDQHEQQVRLDEPGWKTPYYREEPPPAIPDLRKLSLKDALYANPIEGTCRISDAYIKLRNEYIGTAKAIKAYLDDKHKHHKDRAKYREFLDKLTLTLDGQAKRIRSECKGFTLPWDYEFYRIK